MKSKGLRKSTADRLPDIWAIDTEFLLKELARVRDLALRVPSNTTDPLDLHAPINSVIDALWNLETDLRFCLKTQRELQDSFARRAEELKLGKQPLEKDTRVAQAAPTASRSWTP